MSVPFTKEMKKDYTILIPNMSPIHFEIMKAPFALNGYKCILLNNTSHNVIEEGLRYVHNDMCYPALLVIGQMIDAIKRGIADPNIYPNNETPSYAFNWDSAADTIEEILEEAGRNNSKVLIYSEEDGES